MGKQSKFKFSIVLVSFPFEDFKTQKVRPALCLTEPIGDHEHVVLAFISSRIPESLDESDLLIETKVDSGKTTGLITNSVIRFHKIISIPKALIKRRLGQIHESQTEDINQKIKQLFDL
jgi:mRNA interferase MazF